MLERLKVWKEILYSFREQRRNCDGDCEMDVRKEISCNVRKQDRRESEMDVRKEMK